VGAKIGWNSCVAVGGLSDYVPGLVDVSPKRVVKASRGLKVVYNPPAGASKHLHLAGVTPL